MPADSRDALQWFVENFGLYQGSGRGLFLSDFSEEYEASLEAAIISLKSRGFTPLVLTGDAIFKQAEYLWEQSRDKAAFGRPLASKLELDLTGSDVLVLKDLFAPENEKQLWYFHNHVIYPRVLSGKPMVITTSLAYEEFVRYGAACPDFEFAGRTLTWEKLLWLMETSTMNLEQFRLMRQESLPPLLKAEYYLWMALKERNLQPNPQHVLGDYMLDLALVEKDQRLNIEVDGLSSVGGHERQAEEAKRNLVLLADGWQILRFTTAEVLNNHVGCAEVVEEVWRSGRKKSPLGRLITGQSVSEFPEPPVSDDLQHAAIAHGGGPAAVVGGGGTGKTTCLTHRVAYLLSQGVSPESILVLSQSPETLSGIRRGLEKIVDKQVLQRLHLWAWHDLGLKILKENASAIKRKLPIKVEPNPQKVIQRVLAKTKKELDPTTLELSTGIDEFTVAAAISIYKANLVSSADLKDQARDEMEQLMARVFQAYDDQLQRANRIDRDDMVSLAVQSLMERPEIRARYQGHFEFVLVDEYQDVTLAEDTLVRILAAPQDNLYLAGDEDEAIWESKGASPDHLNSVSHRFPQTRCYVLEKNWRSHPAIVDHARQLLTGLKRRFVQKELVSGWGPSQDPGTAIIGPQRLESEKDECDWVAEEIQFLVDGGRALSDIAVLYRYHRYAAVLEESLSRRGVRCHATQPDAGLVPDEMEDMMSFLRLVMDPDGPRAKESFERVCQLRSREVDPKLSSTIASFAEANNLSYMKAVEIYAEATADQSCRDLEQMVRIIRTMHQENLPPAETISLVRRTQRLNDYYRSVNVPPGTNYEPLRKLDLMEEEARQFKTVSEFVKHQTQLKQHQSAGSGDNSGVHVLSLHEAKGREFPVVFMVGLAEGLFPAESAPDLDEERRLCYVGFTRAIELLYLSWPGVFNDLSLQPSPFLVEARLMPAPAPVAAAPPQAAPPPVPVQAPLVPPPKVQSAPPAPPSKPAAPAPLKQPPSPPATPHTVQPTAPAAALAPAQAAAPAAAGPSPRSVPDQYAPSLPHAPTAYPAAGAQVSMPQARQPAAPQPPEPEQNPAMRPPGSGEAAPADTTPVAPAGGGMQQRPDPYGGAGVQSPSYPYAAQPVYPPAEVSARAPGAPICPGCTASLEPGARFCGECGYQLGVRIPACGLCRAPLEPSAKFCGECGSRVEAAYHGPPAGHGGGPAIAPGQPDQQGWLVKFLRFIEPD